MYDMRHTIYGEWYVIHHISYGRVVASCPPEIITYRYYCIAILINSLRVLSRRIAVCLAAVSRLRSRRNASQNRRKPVGRPEAVLLETPACGMRKLSAGSPSFLRVSSLVDRIWSCVVARTMAAHE